MVLLVIETRARHGKFQKFGFSQIGMGWLKLGPASALIVRHDAPFGSSALDGDCRVLRLFRREHSDNGAVVRSEFGRHGGWSDRRAIWL